MAYSSGGLIAATDYNTLGNNLATVWGTGTGNKGWGQDTSSFANVAAGNTVTASQWTNLIGKTNSALSHQGIATITPTSVTAGANVTYYSSITSGIASVTGATSGQTGLSTSDGAASAATYSGTWGVSGNKQLVTVHYVTFASGNQARYFINAGGQIKLTFSRTGGSATTRNTEWSQLATDCGTRRLTATTTAKVGGGGSAATVYVNGWWNVLATDQTLMTQADGVGTYSTNSIYTAARFEGTAQNGGYPTLVIYSVWTNAWTNAFQQAVDGTATSNCVISYPSTTYLANTWGTPTVSPSAYIS